jgi:hypothetical protein
VEADALNEREESQIMPDEQIPGQLSMADDLALAGYVEQVARQFVFAPALVVQIDYGASREKANDEDDSTVQR